MTRTSRFVLPVAALVALAAGPARAFAQSGDATERPMATRADLEASNTESARARLSAGDFRPGDRIIITVQGDTALSDTFAVWRDNALHLPSPTVGTLSLQGVLRSELQDKVQTYVARFVRNPMVRALPLIRLSFQGEYAHSGVYAVPADAPLADAFMAAGGTTTYAAMNKAKIQRNGREFMDSRGLQAAIADGRTVDDLGLRDGDQFVMPKGNGGSTMGIIRGAAVVTSLGVGILTLSRHH
jgi:protein involved in polysaccharide export with SLBB domain